MLITQINIWSNCQGQIKNFIRFYMRVTESNVAALFRTLTLYIHKRREIRLEL